MSLEIYGRGEGGRKWMGRVLVALNVMAVGVMAINTIPVFP